MAQHSSGGTVKRTAVVIVAVALSLSCKSGEERAAERQKSLEEQKSKLKDERAKADAPKGSADSGPKDAFWDDPSYVELRPDGKCPEGMWALFAAPAPGADAAEKKANEAKRSELAAKLKATTFVTRFRAGLGVDVADYDAAKGLYPVAVQATLDCSDSAGSVTIALADAKATVPPNSAAKGDADFVVRIWMAEPSRFQIPMKSMADAKTWKEKSLLGLEARYVFTLGKTAIDHKMNKVAKHVEKTVAGDISIGGGAEDWGAGRMVRADVKAMRLSTDRGREVITEKR